MPGIQTVGGLIDALLKEENTHWRLWCRSAAQKVGFQKWEALQTTELSQGTVIYFSRLFAEQIAIEAQHWSQEEPYEETLRQGHALLQKIHEVASANGVGIEAEEIDIPLTPTESMVAAGFVKVVDGRVLLTDQARENLKGFETPGDV